MIIAFLNAKEFYTLRSHTASVLQKIGLSNNVNLNSALLKSPNTNLQCFSNVCVTFLNKFSLRAKKVKFGQNNFSTL